jgi:HEAT repeat protein
VFERLDETDWARLTHMYGPATDIPDLLRRAGSGEEQEAYDAIDQLYSNIWDEGDLFPATAATVPFLFELVAEESTRHRGTLLYMINKIADPAGDQVGTEHASAARRAVIAGVPVLLCLLDDRNAAVRAGSAHVLGLLAERAPELVPTLRARAAATGVPTDRAALVLAAGALPAPDRTAWLRTVLAGQDSLGVRAAAAIRLCEAGDGEAPEVASVLSTALFAGSTDLDSLAGWYASDRTYWIWETLRRLPSVHEELIGQGLRHADAAQRRAALNQCAELIETWRDAPARLVPKLTALFDDPDPVVRRGATYEAATAGRATTLVADALVRALDSPDPDVAKHAREGLTRIGRIAGPHADAQPDDPEELRRLMHAGSSGYNRMDAAARLWRATGDSGALELLRAALTAGEAESVWAAEGLVDAGPAATPFVSAALPMLDSEYTNVRIMGAVLVWRATGDAERVLEPLLSTLRTLDGWWAIRSVECVGELGPAAAKAVPVLHAIVADPRRHQPDVIGDEQYRDAALAALARITAR